MNCATFENESIFRLVFFGDFLNLYNLSRQIEVNLYAVLNISSICKNYIKRIDQLKKSMRTMLNCLKNRKNLKIVSVDCCCKTRLKRIWSMTTRNILLHETALELEDN